jgi:hypothetical protein
MVPGLEDRLMEGSEENFDHIAELVRGFIIICCFVLIPTDTKRLLSIKVRRHEVPKKCHH